MHRRAQHTILTAHLSVCLQASAQAGTEKCGRLLRSAVEVLLQSCLWPTNPGVHQSSSAMATAVCDFTNSTQHSISAAAIMSLEQQQSALSTQLVAWALLHDTVLNSITHMVVAALCDSRSEHAARMNYRHVANNVRSCFWVTGVESQQKTCAVIVVQQGCSRTIVTSRLPFII